MISVVFYLIWALNVLFVLIKRKSKILTILSIVVSVFIVYKSTSTNDYWVYYKFYQSNTSGGIEIGYTTIMHLAKSFGLSYNDLLLVVSLVCFGILLFIYKKYTDNFQVFFSLYFLYEYALDITQVRNFLASSLLLIVFYFIIKEKRIFAFLVLVIASTMHISMVFYFPLIFLKPESYRNRRVLKYCAIIIAFLCVLLKLAGSRFSALSDILSVAVRSTDLGDKSSYFYSLSNNGYLLYFLLCAVNIFIFMYSRNVILNNIGKNSDVSDVELLLDMGLLINLYCVFSFPFIILNMSFYRLFRNVYIINVMVCCIAADSFKSTTTSYYKYIIVTIMGNLLYKLPWVHGSTLLTPILDEFK